MSEEMKDKPHVKVYCIPDYETKKKLVEHLKETIEQQSPVSNVIKNDDTILYLLSRNEVMRLVSPDVEFVEEDLLESDAVLMKNCYMEEHLCDEFTTRIMIMVNDCVRSSDVRILPATLGPITYKSFDYSMYFNQIKEKDDENVRLRHDLCY